MLRNIEWNGVMTIYTDTVSYLLLSPPVLFISQYHSFYQHFPSQIISLSIPAFPNTTPQSVHLINNPFSYSSHPILENHLSFTLLLKQLLKASSSKVSFYPENFLCSTHPKMDFPSFAVRSCLSRGEVEDSWSLRELYNLMEYIVFSPSENQIDKSSFTVTLYHMQFWDNKQMMGCLRHY